MTAIQISRRPHPAKREAILAAARQVCLREGYAASMDAIAAAAGVSKQTVYNHFQSKNELFQAVVADYANEMTEPLSAASGTADPAAVLTTVAEYFFDRLMGEPFVELYRLLVGQARQFPELAREYYLGGPGQSVVRLAAWLADQTRRGQLAVTEPTLAAEQFFAMVVSHMQMRRLFGVNEVPDAAERRRRIRYAVESFLRAHRPA
jgi:TetR/AcrR family transcriptional repressor of mexJK operon